MKKLAFSLALLVVTTSLVFGKDEDSLSVVISLIEQIKKEGRIQPARNVSVPSLDDLNRKLSNTLKVLGRIREYKINENSIAPLFHQYIFDVTYESGFQQHYAIYLFKEETGWVVTNIFFEKADNIRPNKLLQLTP